MFEENPSFVDSPIRIPVLVSSIRHAMDERMGVFVDVSWKNRTNNTSSFHGNFYILHNLKKKNRNSRFTVSRNDFGDI